MLLLGDLGLFDGIVGITEIGTGILQILVQEEPVHGPGEIVMVGHVAPRGAEAVAVQDGTHGLSGHPRPEAGGAFVHREVGADQLHEVPQGALFDLEVAVHVGFPEIKVGVEGQSQRRAVLLEPDPHIEARGREPGIHFPDDECFLGCDHGKFAVGKQALQ